MSETPEVRTKRIVAEIRWALILLGIKEGDACLQAVELAYEPILAEFKEAIRDARESEATQQIARGER